MPGLLPHSYREGNRCEYFAQYILSGLGVSSPVSRQEDIGIDFYCALARRDGKRLYFDSPFAVQVGSEDGKSFSYGVDRRTKPWKWKPYEIEWLFSQSLPLFLATVDQKNLTVRIYSTSPMWITRYKYGSVTEVIFVPGATHDPGNEVRQDDLLPEGFGDRHTYRIPLFAPIVELEISSFDEDTAQSARDALRKAIATESKNLRYRDLGVHFSEWLLDIAPNDPAAQYKVGHFYAWNNAPGQNVARQLDSLLPIVVALVQNLSAQGSLAGLNNLLPIFNLFSPESLPEFVRTMMQDLGKKVEQQSGVERSSAEAPDRRSL